MQPCSAVATSLTCSSHTCLMSVMSAWRYRARQPQPSTAFNGPPGPLKPWSVHTLTLPHKHVSLRVQVFEQRPAPRDKYGGSCRLEPNGLNAVEALGKGLLRDVVAHATLSKTILMHDTEGDHS